MAEPLNFLLITTDQQRMDSLGAYGRRTARRDGAPLTPAFDALARSGTLFHRAYTPTAICTPARASLITGLRPHRHNLLANYERNVGFQEELTEGPGIVPFSRPLRAAGYDVVSIGKWHVGKERGPDAFGFEGTHYPGWGEPVRHEDYLRYLRERGLGPFEVEDPIRGTFPNGLPSNITAGIYQGPPEGTFSAFLAERAIARLRAAAQRRRRDGRPFFLALQFFGPHLPYYLPREYAELVDPDAVELPGSLAETFEGKPQVQRNYAEHWTGFQFDEASWRRILARYLGYVALIDDQMARVLAALEADGLAASTAVAFTSDHGGFVGGHRLQDKGPAMYDDIYRIPMAWRLPGGPAGQHRDELVSLIDIAPTLTALAGSVTPAAYEGRDLTPLLRGERVPAWRDVVTAEFHGHHFPYPQRMIFDGRYKLVVNPPDRDELYDLREDPLELTNRIDDTRLRTPRDGLYRRLYRELKARGDKFYHWMTSMSPVGESDVDASLSQHSAR
ncbi:MAG TPA: sulfatase-like hydrolase/transferase [Trueperaceae bacterium]|nr:sulfatase-like hydrolase/transferase [Trueperaceae bacterium]